MATTNPPTLQDLLESLPPELYDTIYQETFSTPTPNKVKIDNTYLPPTSLQVDHRTRARAAKEFYSNTIFIGTCADCWQWLSSLSKEHAQIVFKIHAAFSGGTTSHYARMNAIHVFWDLGAYQYLWRFAFERGNGDPRGMFKCCNEAMEEEGDALDVAL